MNRAARTEPTMRAFIQRVASAAVLVDGRTASRIDRGLLVYLAVATDDTEEESRGLAEKTRYLRIFEDAEGRLNRDVVDAGGSILVVSAFTLLGDARKGRRPFFGGAAPADTARPVYERYCRCLEEAGLAVARGVFGALMHVQSVNDGPVCILLETGSC